MFPIGRRVVLVPVEGKLAIDLHGETGTVLKMAASNKGGNVPDPVSEQLVMVAGTCKLHKLPFTATGLTSAR